MFLIHKQVLSHYGGFPKFQDCEQYLIRYDPWFKILMGKLNDVIWGCLIISIDAIMLDILYWVTTFEGSDKIDMISKYFVISSSILAVIQWMIYKIAQSGFKIMVVSHRWEDSTYPDPSGSQFTNLMSEEFSYMFYDYTCLPQRPRSKGDQEIFDRELHNMDDYYKYLNTFYLFEEDYFDRGWCVFEYVCKHSSIFGLMKIQLGSYPMGWNIILTANRNKYWPLMMIMIPIIVCSTPVHIYKYISGVIFRKRIDYDQVLFTNGDDKIILLKKLRL